MTRRATRPLRSNLLLYIVRRLAAMAVLLVIISFGIFSLLYVSPGSVIDVLRGGRPITAADLAALERYYHLNEPFLAQYGYWLINAVHLNFGNSLLTGQPVVTILRSDFVITATLGCLAFVMALLFGIGFGILTALRRRSAFDRAVVGLSVVGVSAPAFATGIVLLYVFGVLVQWFPIYGAGSGFASRLDHLVLPAIALAITGTALILKLTRTAVAEVLEQDYVAFAHARGTNEARVIGRYVLRNALVPVITASGMVFAYMLVGAVLVEVTFSLTGLGALLVQSVTNKDIPVVQGLTILTASLILLINLAMDVLYLLIDPRIRFEKSAR